MTQTLDKQVRDNLKDINTAFKYAERNNCEIDYCFNVMEVSAKLIRDMQERIKDLESTRQIAIFMAADKSHNCGVLQEKLDIAVEALDTARDFIHYLKNDFKGEIHVIGSQPGNGWLKDNLKLKALEAALANIKD